jgi:hypothetical protein
MDFNRRRAYRRATIRKSKKELRQFFEFYVRLALCSKEQFREGKNLQGTRFSACVKSELSGSLIWGVQ